MALELQIHLEQFCPRVSALGLPCQYRDQKIKKRQLKMAMWVTGNMHISDYLRLSYSSPTHESHSKVVVKSMHLSVGALCDIMVVPTYAARMMFSCGILLVT